MRVIDVLEQDEFQKQAFTGSRKEEIDYLTRVGVQLDWRVRKIREVLRSNNAIAPNQMNELQKKLGDLQGKHKTVLEKIRELTIRGHSFCFTGFRDKDMEATISQLGGRVVSSASGKLDFLVAADPSEQSGKLTKARELGIKVLSRQQMTHILRGDMPRR